MKEKVKKQKRRISTKFTWVLALISIVGFLEIILHSFFDYSLQDYSSFFWLIIMGAGFLIIARPKKIYDKSKEGFTELSFYRLTTFVIGLLALIAGFLSLPQFNLIHPIFLAIKGVISIIAIIFIIIQTWVIRE